MATLNLTNIVCVFDQAPYAKDRFSDIILRMGAFHTICTLLGILGKCFADAGLQDLCIDTNVITEGFIAGVMEGRKYNHAIHMMTKKSWKNSLMT